MCGTRKMKNFEKCLVSGNESKKLKDPQAYKHLRVFLLKMRGKISSQLFFFFDFFVIFVVFVLLRTPRRIPQAHEKITHVGYPERPSFPHYPFFCQHSGVEKISQDDHSHFVNSTLFQTFGDIDHRLDRRPFSFPLSSKCCVTGSIILFLFLFLTFLYRFSDAQEYSQTFRG